MPFSVYSANPESDWGRRRNPNTHKYPGFRSYRSDDFFETLKLREEWKRQVCRGSENIRG